MTRKRRALRIAGFLAAGLVVLLGIGALAVRAVLAPERLRAEAIRLAERATGLDVSLAAAELSWTPFGVSLRELRIGPESDPVLRMESGMARLDAGALLGKRVVVERLTLTAPRLSLRPRSAPTETEPAAGGPGAAAPTAPAVAGAFAGEIRSFEIVDGELRILTPGGEGDIALDGLDLQGSLSYAPGGRSVRSAGTLSLEGLSLAALHAYRETLDRLHPVVRFAAEYRPTEGALDFSSIRLTAAPLDLEMAARIHGLPAAPGLELTLQPTTMDLAELLPLIPPAALPAGISPIASGPVTVEANVSGPLGSPDTAPTVSWRASFADAAFGLDGKPVLRALRGEVAARAGAIELRDLRASVGDDGSLSASGTVHPPAGPGSAPAYDIVVQGDADVALARTWGLLPEGTEAGGRVSLDVRAVSEGVPGTAPSLDGTISLSDGRFRSPEMSVAATGWSAGSRLTGGDLVLDHAGGRLGHSDFDVRGTVRNVAAAPEMSLTGRSRRLDLTELAAPGSPSKPAAPGSATEGPSHPDPDPLVPVFPPFPTVIELEIDSLYTEGAAMASVSLHAEGRGTKGSVRARVGGADYGGVLLHDFRTSLSLAGQTATGEFQAPRVDAFHVPLRTVRGKVALGEDRVLHLTDMTAQAWDGAVEGTAAVDLTDPLAPAFDIRTEAKGLQANDFLSTVTPAKNLVFGTVDLSSSFTGKGATPEEITRALTGDGTFSARDGRLARTPTTTAIWKALNLGERDAMPFRDLLTAFSIRDGRLVTDALTLEGGNAKWKAAGSLGFDGQLDYRVEVELDDELSDLYRRRIGRDLASLFANTSGRLVLDLEISGNASDPRVTLDRAKVAGRAREQVGQAVKKGLSDGIRKLFGGAPKKAEPEEPPPEEPDSTLRISGGD